MMLVSTDFMSSCEALPVRIGVEKVFFFWRSLNGSDRITLVEKLPKNLAHHALFMALQPRYIMKNIELWLHM